MCDTEIFVYGWQYGLSGIDDLYNCTNKSIIDLKACRERFLDKWIIQTFVYACIHPGKIDYDFDPQSVQVYNALHGVLFTASIDVQPSIRDNIIEHICEVLKLPNECIQELISCNTKRFLRKIQ